MSGCCGEFSAKEQHVQRLQGCKELGISEEQWEDDDEESGKGTKSTKPYVSPC